MAKRFGIRMVLMFAGYGLAVLVASAVTLAIMLAPAALPDGGARGSLFGSLGRLQGMMLVGVAITATHAFPGWLATVTLAEFRKTASMNYFAVAGVLTALSALWVFEGLPPAVFGYPPFHGAALTGGLAGGLIYWQVAGNSSGAWRDKEARAVPALPVGMKEQATPGPAHAFLTST